MASSCGDLRKIDLTSMGASSQAFAAFHEALGGNAWPRLEEIKLFYDDEEMAGDLMSTLAVTGVGTSLRHMELKWPVNQGVVVQQLADIFHQGACPALRRLTFRTNCNHFDDLEAAKRLKGSLAGRARVETCR